MVLTAGNQVPFWAFFFLKKPGVRSYLSIQDSQKISALSGSIVYDKDWFVLVFADGRPNSRSQMRALSARFVFDQDEQYQVQRREMSKF